MHLHELNLDYRPAAAALVAHCGDNPTSSVGTLSLAELNALLPSAKDLAAQMWSAPSADAIAASAASPPERSLPELAPESGAEALKPETLKPAGTYKVGARACPMPVASVCSPGHK